MLQRKPGSRVLTAIVSGKRSHALELARKSFGTYRLAVEILCGEIEPTELESIEWLAKDALFLDKLFVKALQGTDPTHLEEEIRTLDLMVHTKLRLIFLGAAFYELSQQGESHRDKAKEYLESCIDVLAGGTYPKLVAQVMLNKLDEDPSWPESLRNGQ